MHKGDKPGLPITELMLLKDEIRKMLPQYWNAPQEIELLWSKCTDSISQACKRLRVKKSKRSQCKDSSTIFMYTYTCIYKNCDD